LEFHWTPVGKTDERRRWEPETGGQFACPARKVELRESRDVLKAHSTIMNVSLVCEASMKEPTL
jgi:hypothetical protein